MLKSEEEGTMATKQSDDKANQRSNDEVDDRIDDNDNNGDDDTDDDFQSCASNTPSNNEGQPLILRRSRAGPRREQDDEEEGEEQQNDDDEQQNLIPSNRTTSRRRNDGNNRQRRRRRSTIPTRISVTALLLEADSSPFSNLIDQCLFFGCGLGSSLSYIATLSALVYFKMLYGANSFVFLNAAVFLPLLPISLAQARWDQYLDQQYRSRRTFLVRGIVAFGMILWGTSQMALDTATVTTTSSLSSAIQNTLWQGIGSAILYGTLNQMASFVITSTDINVGSGGGGDSLKATVSAGVQASALLALALSLLTGFNGDTPEGRDHFSIFLWWITTVESICCGMFSWLLLRRPMVAASMLRRDYSIRSDEDIGNDDENNDHGHNSDEESPLLLNDNDDNDEDTLECEMPLLDSVSSSTNGSGLSNHISDVGDDDQNVPLRRRLFDSSSISQHSGGQRPHGRNQRRRSPIELSYSQLWKKTRECCLVLVGTLIPSFLVGSWFTRVETDWMQLAQVLFYVRIASDFVGRLATICVPPKSVPCLTWTMALRYIPVICFFLNSKQEGAEVLIEDTIPGMGNVNDLLSIFLVAVIAFQSGYLVTGCFQLAPLALPVEHRESNQSKQASMLTVAFSISAILGLLSSFALIAIGV